MQLASKTPSIIRFSLVLAALACGSDSDGDGGGDGALCTTFTACGGDPTGTWEAGDICLPDGFGENIATGLPAECNGAIVLEDTTSDATLTFGADGTVSQAGVATVDWAMAFDQPCISAAAGQPADDAIITAFCDGFLDSITTGEDAAFSEATCDVVDATCRCDALQEADISATGQYTIAGNTIDFGAEEPQEFCVDGDQLKLGAGSDPLLAGAHQVYLRTTP